MHVHINRMPHGGIADELVQLGDSVLVDHVKMHFVLCGVKNIRHGFGGHVMVRLVCAGFCLLRIEHQLRRLRNIRSSNILSSGSF